MWTTVATIPRISGRSSCTPVWWIRLSPSERSVSRWFCLAPMVDRVWVTFSCAISGPLTGARPEHGGGGDVLGGETPAGPGLPRGGGGLLRPAGGVAHVV